MIKLFAFLIMVLSGAYVGIILCRNEKRKLDFLKELLNLVLFILWNIENRSEPLFSISENYKKEAENQGGTSKEFIKELFSVRGELGNKIDVVSQKICSSETVWELSDFSKTLGKTDKETQISKAKNAVNILEKELNFKKQEYLSKSRLYKILPSLIAALIALLLY